MQKKTNVTYIIIIIPYSMNKIIASVHAEQINWIMKWIMSKKIRPLNDLIDELYFV